MKKTAMILPLGLTAARGIRDSLTILGWETITWPIQTKHDTAGLISQRDVSLIVGSCRYGTRHLPVGLVNERHIPVALEALPLNESGFCPPGMLGCADPADPAIIDRLDRAILFTPSEPSVWWQLFGTWLDLGRQIHHIPLAVNLGLCPPKTMRKQADLLLMGNFTGREADLERWIVPVLQRGMGRWKTAIHGDMAWQRFGISPHPIPANPIDAYGIAKVSVNLHDAWYRDHGAILNEDTYSIPLCGSIQVVDSPLARAYLGNDTVVVSSPSELCQGVERLVNGEPRPPDKVLNQVETIVSCHTHLHRMRDLFILLDLIEEADLAGKAAIREGQALLWKTEALLRAEG